MKREIRVTTCSIIGFFAVAVASAWGQGALLHRPAGPPAYVLGPGDQVSLHVTDLDDISDRPVTLDPNGDLDLPLAGRVHAGGLTMDQFKAELTRKLSPYINSPEIAANLVVSQSRPVSVIGEVFTPGVHQVGTSQHLVDVLSAAGGLKPDAGPAVVVTRDLRWGRLDVPGATDDPVNGTSTASIAVDPLLSGKDPARNIVVEPHDVVSVPRGELIYVVGEVKKPGGFEMSTHSTMSVLQALSLAQGLAGDNSAKRAQILRPSPGGDGAPHQIPVDIPKILDGKAPDAKLYANDVLYIPHSSLKVISRRAAEAAIGVTTGIAIYR